MESVLVVVHSPLFLGVLIFLGIASLIRILLAREPGLKRNHDGDRRRSNGKMPEPPFYDSNGVRVTENRRSRPDRRRARLFPMQHEMKEDSMAG